MAANFKLLESNGYGVRHEEDVCSQTCCLELITTCSDALPRMSNGRNRRAVLVSLGLCIMFLGFILLIYPSPDLSAEQEIVHKITELEEQLRHSNKLNDQRKADLQEVALDFVQLLNMVKKHQDQYENNNSPLNHKLAEYQARGLLGSNLTGRYELTVPGLAAFLPNTLSSPRALIPAVRITKDRSHVSIVIGIPTVKREFQSYLIPTLQSIFDNISEDEMDEVLVVVFIAEIDPENVFQISSEIQGQFSKHLDSGILEIISPPSEFYPDMTGLKKTLGDEMDRVVWRSKQALDFSFLMMYAQSRGTFYVQLEDDVLTKKGFIKIMKNFAMEKIVSRQNWFVIDFCQLGFIGKMFRSNDLPWLVQFFLMFYNDKPVDWLLENLIQTKICKLDQDHKKCKKEKEKLWIHYKPSLFQHIGTHSSLKGKVQKLKDRQFGRVQLFVPHKNPQAVIESPIRHYKHYSLSRAYRGDTFFWGLVPQVGDTILFKFQPPILLESYKLVTGNVEHPSDRFLNTTCEVKLTAANAAAAAGGPSGGQTVVTPDGYHVVGSFNSFGLAEGKLGRSWGEVDTFRLTVHTTSDNWAILSEIHFQPVS